MCKLNLPLWEQNIENILVHGISDTTGSLYNSRKLETTVHDGDVFIYYIIDIWIISLSQIKCCMFISGTKTVLLLITFD